MRPPGQGPGPDSDPDRAAAARKIAGPMPQYPKAAEEAGVSADPDVARRFADLDRAEFPRLAERIPDRYTDGVALRAQTDQGDLFIIQGYQGFTNLVFWVDTDGKPYMIYCHEWLQNWNGTMEKIELTPLDRLTAPPTRRWKTRTT